MALRATSVSNLTLHRPSSSPDSDLTGPERRYINFTHSNYGDFNASRLFVFIRAYYGESFGCKALKYAILAWSAAFRSRICRDIETKCTSSVDAGQFISKFHYSMAEDIRKDQVHMGHVFGSYFAIQYTRCIRMAGLSTMDRVTTCRSYFRGMIQILDCLKRSSNFLVEASPVKFGLDQLSKRTASSDIPEFGHFGRFINDALSFDSLVVLDGFREYHRSTRSGEKSAEEFWKWENRKATQRLFETMATFHKLYFESGSRNSGWKDRAELFSQLNFRRKLVRSLSKEPVVSLFEMVPPVWRLLI
jgi:hypothetical protein